MTRFSFFSAGATHVGCVRKRNEDAFLENAAAGLWAVADGVGGAAAGDHASGHVVATLGAIRPQPTGDALLAAVRGGLETANADLLDFATRQKFKHVAATVAVLLCAGEECWALWAGDCRIYRLRRRAIAAMTRDHSALQELIDSGVLAAHQALKHPSPDIVTRAVGAAERLNLGYANERIEDGDIFLLCTDGLIKLASDEEIGMVLADCRPEAAPARLIDLGLARGAPDNLTAVVVAACALAPG